MVLVPMCLENTRPVMVLAQKRTSKTSNASY